MADEQFPVQRDWLDPYIALDDASIATKRDWLRLVAHRILDDLGETYAKEPEPVYFAYKVIIDSFWFIAYKMAGTSREGQDQIEVVGYWRDSTPPGLTTMQKIHALPKGWIKEGPGRIVHSVDMEISKDSTRVRNYKVINPKPIFDYGEYKV